MKPLLSKGKVYIKYVGTDRIEVPFFVATSEDRGYTHVYLAITENKDKYSIHDCGGYMWQREDNKYSIDSLFMLNLCPSNFRKATHNEAIEFSKRLKTDSFIETIRMEYKNGLLE